MGGILIDREYSSFFIDILLFVVSSVVIMVFLNNVYRAFCHLWMALASTSLLPAIYFIKIRLKVFNFQCDALNLCLDLLLYLGVPLVMSLISLLWMKGQSDDSINSGADEIAPVNHEYLPVYLGYIFVSLSLPVNTAGGADWLPLIVVYLLICLFVTFSRTLCFNPLFIIFGYGYYQVTTQSKVKVFVITKRQIRKGDKPSFAKLHKVNELVFIDTEKKL